MAALDVLGVLALPSVPSPDAPGPWRTAAHGLDARLVVIADDGGWDHPDVARPRRKKASADAKSRCSRSNTWITWPPCGPAGMAGVALAGTVVATSRVVGDIGGQDSDHDPTLAAPGNCACSSVGPLRCM